MQAKNNCLAQNDTVLVCKMHIMWNAHVPALKQHTVHWKTLNVRVSTTQLGLLPPAIRSVLDGTELSLFCCFLQFFFLFLSRSQWISFSVYSIPTNEQTNEKKPSAEWIKLCNLASRKWTAVKASIHLVMVTDFVESVAFFLILVG